MMIQIDVIRVASAATLAAGLLALAGCGGGGSESETTAPPASTANEVPAAASQSVAGLIGWASTLPPSETTTPLATDTFQPPVDDTAQPMPV